MNVLVDSDILIEVIRARNVSVVEQWEVLVDSENTIAYSPISLAELWRGARPSEHAGLNAMFDAIICIPADAVIGRMAGDLLHLYSKSHSLDVADAFIAATAIKHDAALWTRNRKHYPMKALTFY